MSVVDHHPEPSVSTRSVLHPTDFSAGSHVAFAHALRIALCGRGRLTLVHVGRRDKVAWTEFPGIRETLSRWGLVGRNASRADVVALGLTATKVSVEDRDPVRGVLKRALKAKADLLVLSSHRRRGLWRWLRPSVGLAIARESDLPCLFLPSRVRGFVDRRTGDPTIRRVLIPVAPDVDPEPAVREVRGLLADLALTEAVLCFLYVNGGDPIEVSSGDHPVEHVRRDGSVVDSIEEVSRAGVDLVAMASLGRESASDSVFGSTTEQVLGRLRVPLLIVPGGR